MTGCHLKAIINDSLSFVKRNFSKIVRYREKSSATKDMAPSPNGEGAMSFVVFFTRSLMRDSAEDHT